MTIVIVELSGHGPNPTTWSPNLQGTLPKFTTTTNQITTWTVTVARRCSAFIQRKYFLYLHASGCCVWLTFCNIAYPTTASRLRFTTMKLFNFKDIPSPNRQSRSISIIYKGLRDLLRLPASLYKYLKFSSITFHVSPPFVIGPSTIYNLIIRSYPAHNSWPSNIKNTFLI